LIIVISTLQVFPQPVEYVINYFLKQLMHFIRQLAAIAIAGKVLPELVHDWVNTRSEQSVNIDDFARL